MRITLLALCLVTTACGSSNTTQAPAGDGSASDAATTLVSGSFEMQVVDAFAVAGRDSIVTGRIASGSVSVGDTVCLVSGATGSAEYVVGGIELKRELRDTASAGEMAGIELKGFDHRALEKGDKVALRASC